MSLNFRTQPRKSEATTLDNLDIYQLRELAAISANPRHTAKMIASRVRLFRRLGLIVPTEPPRSPMGSQVKRPPARAFAVTELGLGILAKHGLSPQVST